MRTAKKLMAFLVLAFVIITTVACNNAETKDKTEQNMKEKETDTKSKSEGIDYKALVNKLNPLPEEWEDELEISNTVNSVGDDVEVESKAYEAFLKLKEDLQKNNGIYIELDSARRSVAEQQKIMYDFIKKYGEVYADKTVAVPGYSEHHTGLALDLYFRLKDEDGNYKDIYYNEDMVMYPHIWEQIHAKLADYGFILRYPDGREHITGYGYEPWHIRYIDDVNAANEIMKQGLTLEEYLSGERLPEVRVNYGKSKRYSHDELAEAVVQIKCEFSKMEGLELHALNYVENEKKAKKALKRINMIFEDADYTQAVCFISSFHTPSDADKNHWEPDKEYTDMKWWLARSKDGEWELVLYGRDDNI